MDRHGAALLATARRYSRCVADADDAYQRSIELLLTKGPRTDDFDHLLAWTLTVCKNEVLMSQRKAAHNAGPFDEDQSDVLPAPGTPSDRFETLEQLGRSGEALRRLKPDQLRCLLLRADGLDYDGIGRMTGFSYAKVNRCLSEGRRAFRERMDRLDSGSECRRIDGILSMVADGAAGPRAELDAQLHLAHCLGCQATLREYRSAPSRAAAMLPVGVLVPAAGEHASGAVRSFADFLATLGQSLQERVAPFVANPGAEVVLVKKAALVTAVSASLIAGGAGIESAVERSGRTDRSHAESSQATEPGKREASAPVAVDRPAIQPDGQSIDHEGQPAEDADPAEVIERQVPDATPPASTGDPGFETSVPADESTAPALGAQQEAPQSGSSSDPSGEFAP